MYGESGPEVTREDQERRCKLRLLAFLTVRHPNLDRIRLPAASRFPLTFDDNLPGYSHVLIAEKSGIYDVGDCSFLWDNVIKSIEVRSGCSYEDSSYSKKEIEYHDEIMNATKIRQLEWTEICKTPNEELVISPVAPQIRADIFTSEVQDP